MQRHAELYASCFLLFFTVGCGGAFSTPDGPTSDVPGIAFTGSVYGGRQPIVGAHIYLMTATTAANAVTTTPTYGSPSTSILTSGTGTDSIGTYVTTSATGTFTITGDYTCSGGALTYALAVGGNPGDGVNSSAVLVDVLGACPGTAGSTGNTLVSTTPNIAINEITTVAAAYALSPFAKDGTHIGTTTTNVAGLTTAFATAMQLVSPYTGGPYGTTPAVAGYAAASGLSANGTVPYNRISMIADILAACVNSTGPTSHNCSTLFSNSISATNGTPADIFTAAVNIAQNPAANVTNLFGIIPTTPPYITTIAAAPTDLTLAITFTAPNSSNPTRSAFDSAGNLWIPNYGNNSLTQLSPIGVVLSGTSGYTGNSLSNPWGIGVSPKDGTLIAVNNAGKKVSKFTSSGAASTTYTLNNAGYSVAYDSTGLANLATSAGVTSVSLTGAISSLLALGSTTYGVAVNSSGSAWGSSYPGNSLQTNIIVATLPILTAYSGGGLKSPTGVALDSSGNFWIANNAATSSVYYLSKFNSSGSPVSSTGYSGGGLNTSWGVAVDGLGKVFVSNGNGTLSEFSSTGTAISSSSGYATGSTAAIYSVALDNAGNVWAPANDGIICKFIGLATPVSLPLNNTTAGVRP